MAKRNNVYRDVTDATKQLIRDRDSKKQSALPSGYSFVIIDGALHIKKYTKNKTFIAPVDDLFKWKDFTEDSINEQL